MARHKMPQRTKRRLIAAGIAAATLIGTGVVVGISGDAFAWGGRGRSVADTSVLECLPDDPGQSASQAPPAASAPPQQSTSANPPAQQPAANDPGSQAPAEETPAENQPAEQAPAEQAPAEQAPAEQAPAAQQPAKQQPAAKPPAQPVNRAPSYQGLTAAAAYQPPASAAPDPNGPAATAPDEAGPANPATPAPQPQAQDMKQFTKPNCADALGPFPEDFVNIRKVTPLNNTVRPARTGSRGTLTARCGTNQNNHNNPANFIVAPGNANGAHHLHDYVGNLSTDGNSTNDNLAAAGTTCQDTGDKSTYYWPVIRVRDNTGGGAADAENPHNIGRLIKPSSVSLLWRGNAKTKVVAMPDFMRIITGDAKAAINGGANGNAKWGCTGFANRLSAKYPLCPRGSRLQRVLDFPSCWDGVNFDSANHRTHVVFPAKDGTCPAGTKAIPQLHMTLTFNVPARALFAVDAFPEVKHSPITDHGDFTNVMSAQSMNRLVTCINGDKNC
ncbi:MAG: DUF1996 domain-containing protein [Labedaea sp.]